MITLHMRKNMDTVKIFACVLLLVFLIVAPPVISEETGTIEIAIRSNKSKYYSYETIAIDYAITNTCDFPVVTCFKSFGEQFSVIDSDGLSHYNTLSGSYIPSDTLQPGQTYKGMEVIDNRYAVHNPKKYRIYLDLDGAVFSPSDLSDIKSNEIFIDIVKPSEDEAPALELYLKADSIHWTLKGLENRKKAVNTYYAVARQYPKSVYAPSSLYMVMVMANAVESTEILHQACKQFIEQYPDYPYMPYGFTILCESYKAMGEKDTAVDYLKYLANTYPDTTTAEHARYWLERIEKEKWE